MRKYSYDLEKYPPITVPRDPSGIASGLQGLGFTVGFAFV